MRTWSLACLLFLLLAGSARAQQAPLPRAVAQSYVYGAAPRANPHQLEIDMLRRERPSLFWPIGTMAVGALPIVFAAAYLVAGGAVGFFSGDTGKELRDSWPIWTAAGAGAVVTGLGGCWLLHNIRARRPYTQRIRELQDPRRLGAVTW